MSLSHGGVFLGEQLKKTLVPPGWQRDQFDCPLPRSHARTYTNSQTGLHHMTPPFVALSTDDSFAARHQLVVAGYGSRRSKVSISTVFRTKSGCSEASAAELRILAEINIFCVGANAIFNSILHDYKQLCVARRIHAVCGLQWNHKNIDTQEPQFQ